MTPVEAAPPRSQRPRGECLNPGKSSEISWDEIPELFRGGGSRAYPGNVKGASEGTLGEALAKFIARDSVMGFIHHPTTSTDTAWIALHERAEVAIGTPLNLFRDAVSTDPKVRTKVRNKARKVTAKSHRKAWFWTSRPIPEKKEKNGAEV